MLMYNFPLLPILIYSILLAISINAVDVIAGCSIDFDLHENFEAKHPKLHIIFIGTSLMGHPEH